MTTTNSLWITQVGDRVAAIHNLDNITGREATARGTGAPRNFQNERQLLIPK